MMLQQSCWTVIDAGDYVVQFDMDNEKYYPWYDTNGGWIGTAYVVNDFTTLRGMVRMHRYKISRLYH